jgi:hypothetical protein
LCASLLTLSAFFWPLGKRFHLVVEWKYYFFMTKLLDQALEAVRRLPPSAQDDIARVVLRLARDDAEPVTLSSDERAAVSASKAAAARGEFATDEQVRSVWAKHGL